jgi:hypothetical protein
MTSRSGSTVAVGTTIADRPRTDPCERIYAYGSPAVSIISPSNQVHPAAERRYEIGVRRSAWNTLLLQGRMFCRSALGPIRLAIGVWGRASQPHSSKNQAPGPANGGPVVARVSARTRDPKYESAPRFGYLDPWNRGVCERAEPQFGQSCRACPCNPGTETRGAPRHQPRPRSNGRGYNVVADHHEHDE